MEIYYIHSSKIESNTPSITFILNRMKGFEKNRININFVFRGEKNFDVKSFLKDKYNVEYDFKYVKIQLIEVKEKRHFYKKVKNMLKKTNKKEKVILTRTIGLVPHLLNIRKKINARVYFETHDFFYKLWLRKDIKRRKKIKQYIIEKLFFKKLDGLVCVSENQEKLYKKYLNIPIKAIPCGMDLVEPVLNERENILAYIGSLDSHKGISNIISMAKILPSKYKILIIGGKKKEKIDNLNKILKENGILDRITITGWINKKELNNYLKRIKIGLLPLVENFFNCYITSPLKIYDFMSSGVPIIASDIPTINEFICDEKNGYFFDWESREHLKYILKQIEDKRKDYKFIEENQDIAKKFLNKKKSMELFKFLTD